MVLRDDGQIVDAGSGEAVLRELLQSICRWRGGMRAATQTIVCSYVEKLDQD